MSVKILLEVVRTDLGEVDDHHGSPGYTDALGDGAAHRHQPAGPAGRDLPQPRQEVQPGVLTGEAGRGGGQGGEVEEDQNEEERGGQSCAQHVPLYVGLQQESLRRTDASVH